MIVCILFISVSFVYLFKKKTVCITFIYIHVLFCSEPEEALKSLGELQKVSRPVAIAFGEMMTLMSQCQQVDTNRNHRGRSTSVANPSMARGLLTNNPLTLLSGIIPGKYPNQT